MPANLHSSQQIHRSSDEKVHSVVVDGIVKRKPGRPPGSKNLCSTSSSNKSKEVVKGRRGRPLGSKNIVRKSPGRPRKNLSDSRSESSVEYNLPNQTNYSEKDSASSSVDVMSLEKRYLALGQHITNEVRAIANEEIKKAFSSASFRNIIADEIEKSFDGNQIRDIISSQISDAFSRFNETNDTENEEEEEEEGEVDGEYEEEVEGEIEGEIEGEVDGDDGEVEEDGEVEGEVEEDEGVEGGVEGDERVEGVKGDEGDEGDEGEDDARKGKRKKVQTNNKIVQRKTEEVTDKIERANNGQSSKGGESSGTAVSKRVKQVAKNRRKVRIYYIAVSFIISIFYLHNTYILSFLSSNTQGSAILKYFIHLVFRRRKKNVKKIRGIRKCFHYFVDF